MYKVIDCLKHDNPVINKKLKEVSVEEGLEIAVKLFQILNERKDGIGLAANQVGIDAQVAVLNVREPLILINPKVIEKWNEIPYYEGCLSFPKQGIHTKRYETIHIQTAQDESGWVFSGAPTEVVDDVRQRYDPDTQDTELRLLETVCIQHEIDHLNGMTIHDRENKPEPIRVSKSYGRNEIVMITDGKDTKDLKWKKAKPLIDSGEWVVYVGGPIT